jgi:guanylate kinase
MDFKFKRIIVAGKGGSGKDYLVKMLKESGYTYSVSHTSRPKRDEEIEGVDYYFIEKDEALRMAKNSEFYEYVEFNEWFYGTSIKEFERANLFIMTPSGIAKLKPEHRQESLILFLDIDEEILVERLSKRKDADKADRRIAADREDFKDFVDYDHRITNPNFTLSEIGGLINKRVLEIFSKYPSINIKSNQDD